MSKTLKEFRLEQKFRTRLLVFASFMFLVVVTFIIRLAFLQLVHGYENKILAKKFVSHQEFTVAPRGLLFDRNAALGDEPLVQNIRFINFIIHPEQFENREEAIEYVKVFCNIMGRDYRNYAPLLSPQKWKRTVRKNEFITLVTRMTRKEHERLVTFYTATRKGEYVTHHLRYYTMGPAMAHVSGYIGSPSREDLKKKLVRSYQTIGKAGLEAQYDSLLRGRDGIRLRHRIIDSEEEITATQQGDNLVLTIDKRIQAAAYRSIVKSSRRATVIVMKANTGEILAMVSHPAFDPNILSSGNSEQRRNHIRQVRLHSGFLNLAIQAKFPPASSFKPLLAIAALEDPGTNFSEKTSFFCPGYFSLRRAHSGHPAVTFQCLGIHHHQRIISAIANSCNVFFYNLGYRMGPVPIFEFAKAFGMNEKTGIDLLGEVQGLVPDKRWKQIQYSSRWYDGDTINLSIGQGFLQTTPIALTVFYSAIANRGKIYKPYLVKKITDPIDGQVIQEFKPVLRREIPLSMTNLALIQKGMRQVVVRGTAQRLRGLSVPVAGKTGTVQTRSKKKGKEHAWFASYAPYGGPIEDIIVVVVFVEYGRGGSVSAAPIAKDVYEVAFPKKKSTRRRVVRSSSQRLLNNQSPSITIKKLEKNL